MRQWIANNAEWLFAVGWFFFGLGCYGLCLIHASSKRRQP
jgi:hypothetical protein